MHQLGAKRMRHDVASRPKPETNINRFEADLPVIVAACQQIADYAAPLGITTSLENHGYYVQASDHVQRVVHLVQRDYFKTKLDIGNLWCIGKDPAVAVAKNLPYATIIHFKDFYRRSKLYNPGEGWFQSLSGNYLKGAISGNGDLETRMIVSMIKQSGYDGYISLEFEGAEDCRIGAGIGLGNVRRMWNEA